MRPSAVLREERTHKMEALHEEGYREVEVEGEKVEEEVQEELNEGPSSADRHPGPNPTASSPTEDPVAAPATALNIFHTSM